MKYSLLLVFVFLISSFQSSSSEGPNLEGSWTLIKYKYGHDTELSSVPKMIHYVKNLTRSHFSWCSYNPDDGNIVGTGGGTYHIEGGKYIEETDFWYPSDSGISGTKTAFSYSTKGNLWTIRGYIRSVALDPASGEVNAIDSTYMEEVWQRMEN